MGSCSKCANKIKHQKDRLTCSTCKSTFHIKCVKVDFTKLDKDTWKCNSCLGEDSSDSSHSDSPLSQSKDAILASIASMRTNMEKQIGGVATNVTDIKNELVGVNSAINKMQDTLALLASDNESHKSEFLKIREENDKLKKTVHLLDDKIKDMEQFSRKDNIEITGVPYNRDEDLYGLLDRIAAVIDVNYNINFISTVHRLGVTNERPNPPIIVKFISRDYKSSWIGAARANRKKLTAASLSINWPPTSVYVNEHLSPTNKFILGNAKRLVREKKLAAAWTRDCRIYVKKSAESGAPITLIKTIQQMENFTTDASVNVSVDASG
ncbi:uncharacterized protein LOC111055476 [Nilaparvata lugens]|uniref:uncharacterized protein LOC111055476 n=1 Tax=Nilaparvata lugens TaxID=108931 RepID=UPI00193D897F|nr:uncharacterized protein LOC111055476 [Nilaparvata lugens]